MGIRNNIGTGIMGISVIALSILGMIIHVWTIVLAFLLAGLFAAVMTLIFPVFSQIIWFFTIGNKMGYTNLYCLSIIGYIVLIGFAFFGAIITAGDEEN